jgi:hypothetical protein
MRKTWVIHVHCLNIVASLVNIVSRNMYNDYKEGQQGTIWINNNAATIINDIVRCNTTA